MPIFSVFAVAGIHRDRSRLDDLIVPLGHVLEIDLFEESIRALIVER